MLLLNVAEFYSMLHVRWVDVGSWFFSCCNVAKVDLDVCGVLFFWMLRMLFLNVAKFFHHVACNMVWCCDEIFFYFSFFSATVAHLTSTVDLTALRPSGGPRPSGRPGASNALLNFRFAWMQNPNRSDLIVYLCVWCADLTLIVMWTLLFGKFYPRALNLLPSLRLTFLGKPLLFGPLRFCHFWSIHCRAGRRNAY
jgi:hypothetical protein